MIQRDPGVKRAHMQFNPFDLDSMPKSYKFIAMTADEALAFSLFVQKTLSKRKKDENETSIVGLWWAYCHAVAKKEKELRIEELKKRRSCYTQYDGQNRMCTRHCQLTEYCKGDSNEGYRRCSYCARPSVAGKGMCEFHRKKNLARSKIEHKTRVKRGLCESCGNKKPLGWKKRNCERCARKRTELARKRKERRIRLGLCIQCSTPVNRTNGTISGNGKYQHCPRCRKRQKERECDRVRKAQAGRKKMLTHVDKIIAEYGGEANTVDIRYALERRGFSMKSNHSLGMKLKYHGYKALGKEIADKRNNNAVTVWGPRSNNKAGGDGFHGLRGQKEKADVRGN